MDTDRLASPKTANRERTIALVYRSTGTRLLSRAIVLSLAL